MAATLVLITGASSGIGAALARRAAEEGATVASVSRHPPPGELHLASDLGDPAQWSRVSEWVAEVIRQTRPEQAFLFHCAATLDPIGFAGEVEDAGYTDQVLLDSAAPQVLGHGFIRAVEAAGVRGVLVMITSGAAQTVYEGWTAYGAGKAAVDQWTRIAGAERDRRGGRVRVLAVAPGVVDTGMQSEIRHTDPEDFPRRQRFVELHRDDRLRDPEAVAAELWAVAHRRDLPNGAVLDLRDLHPG